MATPPRVAGDRIGPFELDRVLGRGGGGEVWEAVLHGPGGFRKPVALKLLPPERLGDDQARAMLLREARLGGRVQHPHVVSTLWVAEYDAVLCVALELVRGATIASLRRSLGAPPGRALLDVGVQLAEGLHHIHTLRQDDRPAGLVHRDVKPANVLVDERGAVKLADLGISLVQGDAGEVAGTPGYLAPEQVRGRAEPRSDLFGLGATLYALWVGRAPFGRGNDAVRAAAHADQLLADPSLLAPLDAAVPGLAAVVHGCLRTRPEDRLPSARAVADRLDALRARASGATLARWVGPTTPVVGPSEAGGATFVLPTGNLHPARDGFVGRRALRASIGAALPEALWTVLLGPGGIGKSRLAAEVALSVRHAFPGGVWRVDLEDARDSGAVGAAVARVFDVPYDGRDPMGQLGRWLADKGACVVVLDHVEGCVDGVAEALSRWAALAPQARFLGTSRVRPGLPGEVAIEVEPLPTDEAVALFSARAQRGLGEGERGDVAALCDDLGGMPLAIELAAARVQLLSVAQIRHRLSLQLLAARKGSGPPRHRSVAASLAWSFALLSPPARRALAQLSVFRGGFELASAEAVVDVGSDAPWVLDLLQELVDASWLRVGADGRFASWTLVQAFAASQLDAAEKEAAEARHGATFATIDATEAPRRPKEQANLLAACRRAVARGDEGVAAATLWAAWALVQQRGPLSTGVAVAEEVARALTPGSLAAARADVVWAMALEAIGEEAAAAAPLARALATARALGDRRAESHVLRRLGGLSAQRGDAVEAMERYEAAAGLARDAGDVRLEGHALGVQGNLVMAGGDLDGAAARYGEALALARVAGDRAFEAMLLGNLGVLCTLRDDLPGARHRYREALALHEALGDRRSLGLVWGNLGVVEGAAGHGAAAEEALRRARDVAREVGDRRTESIALANLGGALLAQGRVGEARIAAQAGQLRARSLDDGRVEATAGVVLARVARADGDLPEAARALDAAQERLVAAAAPSVQAELWAARAEVLHALGDPGAAWAVLADAEAVVAAGAVEGRRAVARARATLSAESTS